MSKKERKQIKLQPRIHKPSSELGVKVIGEAKKLETGPQHIVFDYAKYGNKITVLENMRGKSGWLRAVELTTKSFEENNYLFVAACDETGELISDEIARKLFKLPGTASGDMRPCPHEAALKVMVDESFKEFIDSMDKNNGEFFNEEMEKLDRWADDRRTGLKANLKEMDDQIKEMKKAVRQTGTLPEKLALQKKIRNLEGKRDDAWREYDNAAKEVEIKKDELIDTVEKRLKQSISTADLFTISYQIQ